MTLYLTSDECNIDGENTRSSFKNWILPDFFEKRGFNLKLHEIFFDTKFPTLANFNFPHIITIFIGKEHKLHDFPDFFQEKTIFKQLFHSYENYEYSPLVTDQSLCADSFLSEIDFKVFYEIHPRLNLAFSIAFIKDVKIDSQKDVVDFLNGSMFPFHKNKPLHFLEDGYLKIESNIDIIFSKNLLNLLGFKNFDSKIYPFSSHLPSENEYEHKIFVEDSNATVVYPDMLSRMEEESTVYSNYRTLARQKPKGCIKVEFEIGSKLKTFEIEFELDLFHQRSEAFNYDDEINSINQLMLKQYISIVKENVISLEVGLQNISFSEVDKNELDNFIAYMEDRTAIAGLENWGGLFTLKRENDQMILVVFHTNQTKEFFKTFHDNINLQPGAILVKQASFDIFYSSKLKSVSFSPTLCHLLGLSDSTTSFITLQVEEEQEILFPFPLNYYKSARIELKKAFTQNIHFALNLVESSAHEESDSIQCFKTNHDHIFKFKKNIVFFADEHINLKLNSPKLIFVMGNFVQHSLAGSNQQQILNFFPLPKKFNSKVHHVFRKPIVLKTLPGSVFHINLVDENFDQIKADVGKPTLLVLKKSFGDNMFPVTLISSDKNNLELYPENQANHFKNKLSFPLLLNQKDKWGVTLRSLAYPRVKNIFSEYCYLRVTKPSGNESIIISVDDSYVTGGTKLVYLLNKKIKDTLRSVSDLILPKFTLNQGFILFETNDFECYLNGYMIKMLGLTHSYQEKGITFSPSTVTFAVMELNLYIHQPQEMLIISNIVEESFYAQTRPKVLKIVPIPTNQSEFNAYNHIQFDNEDFVPLKLERIDDIQISILTRKGDFVKFIENQDVKCQLEFKQLV